MSAKRICSICGLEMFENDHPFAGDCNQALRAENARLTAENERLHTELKIIIHSCKNIGDLELVVKLAKDALSVRGEE